MTTCKINCHHIVNACNVFGHNFWIHIYSWRVILCSTNLNWICILTLANCPKNFSIIHRTKGFKSLKKLDITYPGWTEYVVTFVPFNLEASSMVYSTLHSLVTGYAWTRPAYWSNLFISPSMANLAAIDATFTILPDVFFTRSEK